MHYTLKFSDKPLDYNYRDPMPLSASIRDRKLPGLLSA